MNNRNTLCPCGSGKKFKKCCINKKQRARSASFELDDNVTVNSMSFNPVTGEVKLLKDGVAVNPKYATSEVSYARRKGPKILSQSPMSTDSTHIVTDQAFDGFDTIFAVDTNTKTVNGESVSVTGVVQGWPVENASPNHTAIGFSSILCIEFLGVTVKPERLGWFEVINLIMESPGYSNSTKVALVVDSDLGSHKNMNIGKEPILESMYLPENFSIFYGSSDVKSETIANQMISLADREADAILELLSASDQTKPLEFIGEGPYTKKRYWRKLNGTDGFNFDQLPP